MTTFFLLQGTTSSILYQLAVCVLNPKRNHPLGRKVPRLLRIHDILLADKKKNNITIVHHETEKSNHIRVCGN